MPLLVLANSTFRNVIKSTYRGSTSQSGLNCINKYRNITTELLLLQSLCLHAQHIISSSPAHWLICLWCKSQLCCSDNAADIQRIVASGKAETDLTFTIRHIFSVHLLELLSWSHYFIVIIQSLVTKLGSTVVQLLALHSKKILSVYSSFLPQYIHMHIRLSGDSNVPLPKWSLDIIQSPVTLHRICGDVWWTDGWSWT